MTPTWLTDTVTSNLDRALHYTLMWGLEALELRTVGSPEDRVPFVNEAKLRRRLEEHDLPVAAIVPGLFEGAAGDRVTWMNEVATLAETLPFCKRIGCARVVVSSFAGDGGQAHASAVEALRRAGDAAYRQGITLAVLNDHEGAHPRGEQLAGLLAAIDHPAVRAAWKPADALRAGEAALTGLQALGDRVVLVRATDGIATPDGWEPAPLGEGAVGWEAVVEHLHRQGFDGPVSLEVTRAPKPKMGLRDATRLIQLLRRA